MESEDREFCRLVLKTLRTLIRSVWLFDPNSCRKWDFKKEMTEMSNELNKAEAKLK